MPYHKSQRHDAPRPAASIWLVIVRVRSLDRRSDRGFNGPDVVGKVHQFRRGQGLVGANDPADRH